MQFGNLIQFQEEIQNLDRPFEASIDAEGREAPRFKAIVSKQTNKVLAVVSQRYSIVQSQDVLANVVSALGKLGISEVSGTLVEQNGRTYAKIFLPNYVSEGMGEKDIQVGILLVNSYDATKAISLIGYAGRLVCSNGMILDKIFGVKMVRKHVGHVHLRIEEAVMEIVRNIVEKSPYLAELIQKAKKDFYEDFKAMDIELKALGFGESVREKILMRLEYSANKYSRWDLYNAITNLYSRKRISENGQIASLKKAEQLLVAPAISSFTELN